VKRSQGAKRRNYALRQQQPKQPSLCSLRLQPLDSRNRNKNKQTAWNQKGKCNAKMRMLLCPLLLLLLLLLLLVESCVAIEEEKKEKKKAAVLPN
jgi:hypothetical protein